MALTKKREEMARTGYGASEVGIIAGLSRFGTPIGIFEKRVYGKTQEEETLPQELGILLEEPLAKKYAADNAVHLVRCDTLRHRVQTFALAISTPDRIAFREKRPTRANIHSVEEMEGAVRNVQIKTASMWDRRSWGDAGTDRIPEVYLAQVQWEMAITGITQTDVPVLFDKAEYAVFHIAYDDQVFQYLYEMVAKFHRDYVLTGTPPPVDSSDEYREFLYNRFSTKGAALKAVEPGSEAEQRVLRFQELKRLAKKTDEELDLIANELRGAIGEAGGLQGPWGKVNWLRAPGTFSTDWEAVARAGIPADQLSALVGQHQKQRAATNQLRATWKETAVINPQE